MFRSTSKEISGARGISRSIHSYDGLPTTPTQKAIPTSALNTIGSALYITVFSDISRSMSKAATEIRLWNTITTTKMEIQYQAIPMMEKTVIGNQV